MTSLTIKVGNKDGNPLVYLLLNPSTPRPIQSKVLQGKRQPEKCLNGQRNELVGRQIDGYPSNQLSFQIWTFYFSERSKLLYCVNLFGLSYPTLLLLQPYSLHCVYNEKPGGTIQSWGANLNTSLPIWKPMIHKNTSTVYARAAPFIIRAFAYVGMSATMTSN